MARIGPRARDEPPVPPQQRLGLDEEARPASSGQGPADRREQGAVGGLEPGMCDLAAQHGELVAQHGELVAQHGELVAQHQDLQVLSGVATDEQGEELDGAAQRQVGELRQHPGGHPRRSAEVSHYRAMVDRISSSDALSEFAHPAAPLTAAATGSMARSPRRRQGVGGVARLTSRGRCGPRFSAPARMRGPPLGEVCSRFTRLFESSHGRSDMPLLNDVNDEGRGQHAVDASEAGQIHLEQTRSTLSTRLRTWRPWPLTLAVISIREAAATFEPVR